MARTANVPSNPWLKIPGEIIVAWLRLAATTASHHGPTPRQEWANLIARIVLAKGDGPDADDTVIRGLIVRVGQVVPGDASFTHTGSTTHVTVSDVRYWIAFLSDRRARAAESPEALYERPGAAEAELTRRYRDACRAAAARAAARAPRFRGTPSSFRAPRTRRRRTTRRRQSFGRARRTSTSRDDGDGGEPPEGPSSTAHGQRRGHEASSRTHARFAGES